MTKKSKLWQNGCLYSVERGAHAAHGSDSGQDGSEDSGCSDAIQGAKEAVGEKGAWNGEGLLVYKQD